MQNPECVQGLTFTLLEEILLGCLILRFPREICLIQAMVLKHCPWLLGWESWKLYHLGKYDYIGKIGCFVKLIYYLGWLHMTCLPRRCHSLIPRGVKTLISYLEQEWEDWLKQEKIHQMVSWLQRFAIIKTTFLKCLFKLNNIFLYRHGMFLLSTICHFKNLEHDNCILAWSDLFLSIYFYILENVFFEKL